MLEEGLNAGVTGILNLEGQAGVKFVGDVLAWAGGLNVGVFADGGRADGTFANTLPLSAGSEFTISGMTRLDGKPIPEDYQGERGNLKLQQNTSVVGTFPVMVTKSTFKKNSKEDGLWDFTHVCVGTAAPTLTGWSSTNAAAAQLFDDKQLWAGLSKIVDPQGLQSGATQRWRIWGIGDNDAAEKTKIDSVLGALVAPYATMKLRPSTFTRLSSNVCLIDATWGLTDTAEDVINAASEVTADPNVLTSHATTAAFNTTPAASGSLIARETTTKEYNDQKTLYTTAHGTRDTKDDREMPGTVTGNDVSDLEDSATVTKVTTSSTPPSVPSAPIGLHHQTVTEQVDRVNWQHVFHYANSTPQQRTEFEGSSTEVDPSGLNDGENFRIVNESSTPPSTPTPVNTALKLRRRVSRRIGGTPEKWAHTFTFDRRTTQDDIEMEGSSINVDPSALEDRTVITLVITSSTPSAPSTPSGLLLVSTESKQRHDTKWAHTFTYERATNQQKLEYSFQRVVIDATDIAPSETKSQLWDSTGGAPSDPATPSGLKLIDKFDVPHTPSRKLRVWRYGKKNNADEITMARTSASATSFGAQRAVTATIIATTDVPSVTSNAAYLLLKDDVTFVDIEVIKLNPDESLKVVTTQVAAKIVRGRSSDTRRVITPAYFDGSDVYVFMRRKIKIGTNLWDYELAEQYMQGEKICFTLSRRVSGSTLPYFTNLLNTKNGASFLGLAAGYVTYKGVAESATNLAVASNRVSEITWEFEYDSLGIIDMADASPGWATTTTDLTSIGPGWVKASDLGLSSTVQPDGDYSGFLA